MISGIVNAIIPLWKKDWEVTTLELQRIIETVIAEYEKLKPLLRQARATQQVDELSSAAKQEIADNIVIEGRSKTDVVQDVYDEIVRIMLETKRPYLHQPSLALANAKEALEDNLERIRNDMCRYANAHPDTSLDEAIELAIRPSLHNVSYIYERLGSEFVGLLPYISTAINAELKE